MFKEPKTRDITVCDWGMRESVQCGHPARYETQQIRHILSTPTNRYRGLRGAGHTNAKKQKHTVIAKTLFLKKDKKRDVHTYQRFPPHRRTTKSSFNLLKVLVLWTDPIRSLFLSYRACLEQLHRVCVPHESR